MNRREFLKTISAAALAVSVPVPLVMGQPAEAGLVMGVDLARFGDEQSIILLRQGRKLIDLQEFGGLHVLEAVDRVGGLIEKWHPSAVLVNGVGIGAGLIDALRDRGFRVTEVNAAAKGWGDVQLSRAWLDRTPVTPHPIQTAEL